MNRVRLAVALVSLACTGGAHGQEAQTPETAAPRYEVEIVVFRHLDQRGQTPEMPMPGPAVAALTDPVAAEGSDTPGPDAVAELYPALDPQSLRLAGIAARLRKSGLYQQIYHGGWVQPVAHRTQAMPTPLPSGARSAGIQGSITLYLERYLHALVDVALGSTPGVNDELHRIHQGRRLRGAIVHYFDHPEFGVILAARPLAGELPDAGEPAPETVDDPANDPAQVQ